MSPVWPTGDLVKKKWKKERRKEKQLQSCSHNLLLSSVYWKITCKSLRLISPIVQTYYCLLLGFPNSCPQMFSLFLPHLSLSLSGRRNIFPSYHTSPGISACHCSLHCSDYITIDAWIAHVSCAVSAFYMLSRDLQTLFDRGILYSYGNICRLMRSVST